MVLPSSSLAVLVVTKGVTKEVTKEATKEVTMGSMVVMGANRQGCCC